MELAFVLAVGLVAGTIMGRAAGVVLALTIPLRQSKAAPDDILARADRVIE